MGVWGRVFCDINILIPPRVMNTNKHSHTNKLSFDYKTEVKILILPYFSYSFFI